MALYTQGNYQERIVNGEVRQMFQSGTFSSALRVKGVRPSIAGRLKRLLSRRAIEGFQFRATGACFFT